MRVVGVVGIHVVTAGPEIFSGQNFLGMQDSDDLVARKRTVLANFNDDVLVLIARIRCSESTKSPYALEASRTRGNSDG